MFKKVYTSVLDYYRNLALVLKPLSFDDGDH
jgi:hypothetical protein